MTRWASASLWLECECRPTINPATYENFEPGDEVDCTEHGPTTVVRRSRVTTK